MSKTSRNDTVWYPTVFMIILALVMTLILAFLEYGTKDRIQMLQNEDFNKKLLYAMNIPFEPSDVDSIVANHIEVRPIDFVDSPESFFQSNYYVYRDGSDVLAVAFPIKGKALWGTVDAIVAMDKDLERMIGLDFVAHSETPGLGGRIDETWYKEQFREILLDSGEKIYFVYPPASNANVEAISGATLTSVSIKDLLNDNIALIKENFKGGL